MSLFVAWSISSVLVELREYPSSLRAAANSSVCSESMLIWPCTCCPTWSPTGDLFFDLVSTHADGSGSPLIWDTVLEAAVIGRLVVQRVSQVGTAVLEVRDQRHVERLDGARLYQDVHNVVTWADEVQPLAPAFSFESNSSLLE